MALALGSAAIYTYARSRSESRSRKEDGSTDFIPPPPGHHGLKGVVRHASARLANPLRHQVHQPEGSLLGPTRSSSSQTSHKSAKSSAASSRTDLRYFDDRRTSSLPGNFPELIATTSGARTDILPVSDSGSSTRRTSPSRQSISDPVEEMTEAAIRASSKLQTFFHQTLGQRLVDTTDGMRATHTKQDFTKPLSNKDAIRSRLLYVCASMSLAADFQEYQRRQAQKSRQDSVERSGSDSSSKNGGPLSAMSGAKEAALKDFVSSQAPLDSKERRALEAAVMLGTKAQIVNAIGQSLKLGNALGLLCAFEAKRLQELSYQNFPELRALLKNQHTPHAKIKAFSRTVDPWWSKQLEDYHEHYTSIRNSNDAKANPVLSSSESRSDSAERHARALRAQERQRLSMMPPAPTSQPAQSAQPRQVSHSRNSSGSGGSSSHGLPKKKRQSSGGAALGTMRLVPSSKNSLSRLSWNRLPPEQRHPAMEPTSTDDEDTGEREKVDDLYETVSLPSRPRRSTSRENSQVDALKRAETVHDDTRSEGTKRGPRAHLTLSRASVSAGNINRGGTLRYLPSTIEEASPTQERTPTRTQSESHIAVQLSRANSRDDGPTSAPRDEPAEPAPRRPVARRRPVPGDSEAVASPVDALSAVDDLEDYLQAAHPELFEGAASGKAQKQGAAKPRPTKPLPKVPARAATMPLASPTNAAQG